MWYKTSQILRGQRVRQKREKAHKWRIQQTCHASTTGKTRTRTNPVDRRDYPKPSAHKNPNRKMQSETHIQRQSRRVSQKRQPSKVIIIHTPWFLGGFLGFTLVFAMVAEHLLQLIHQRVVLLL